MGFNNYSNISKNLTFGQLSYFQEPFAVTVLKLAFESAIALLGIIGNILVCTVIAKCPNLKTPMYCYIFSLAIADLGVLLVNFPLAVLNREDIFYWPFGETLCLYIYPVTDIFFGASIWSITVIGIERYRNIVRNPNIRPQKTSKCQVACVIVAVWLTSFLVIALPVYFITKYDLKLGCFFLWSHRWQALTYHTFGVVFCYVLPLSIISYTYIEISSRIRASSKFLRSMHGQDEVETENCLRIRNNRKAQAILTPLVVLFALTMCPINIFRLITTYYHSFFLWRYYWVSFTFCIVGVIINSACNPIIYTLVSTEFRNGVKSFCKSCQKRPSVHTYKTRLESQCRKLTGGRTSLPFETSCATFETHHDTTV